MAKREHTVRVLHGGGALGAYQAGVYEGIAETGLAPSWIAGVSIGAAGMRHASRYEMGPSLIRPARA